MWVLVGEGEGGRKREREREKEREIKETYNIIPTYISSN